MISKDIIDKAILEHEEKDTTYANCERLAWLYIVRDHIQAYSANSPELASVDGSSEFLKAVNGVPSKSAWAIIDEHMDVIRVIYPKEYDAILDRLRSFHQPHQS